VKVKALLAGLEREHPGIKASLLAALGDVDLRHLLVREREVSRAGSGGERTGS